VADIPLQVNQHLIQGSEVTLCIRSEEIILLPFFGEKKDTANQFIGRIIEITQTNSVARVTVDLGNEWTILAPRTHIRSMHLSLGSEISVSIPPEAIYIIPQSQ
jgi:molybdate/tungstate transport system ATP-binding protein